MSKDKQRGPKLRRPNSWWEFINGWVGVIAFVGFSIVILIVCVLLGTLKSQDVQIAQQQSATRTQFVHDFESRTPAERRAAAQILIDLYNQNGTFTANDYGDNTVQLLQRTVATGEVPAIDTHVAVTTNSSWADPIIDYWYVLLFLLLSFAIGAHVVQFGGTTERKYYMVDLPHGIVRRVLFVAATPTFWPFYLVSWRNLRKYGFMPSESENAAIVSTAS